MGRIGSRMVLSGLVLGSLLSTPSADAQTVRLEGRRFLDEAGEPFFPLIMNYTLDLLVDSGTTDVQSLRVLPSGAYDRNEFDRYEHTTQADLLDQFDDHLDKIASMGFNTLRIVGLVPRMRRDLAGGRHYTLFAKPDGAEWTADVRMELDTAGFADPVSERLFALSRLALARASAKGFRSILLCADDYKPEATPEEQLTPADDAAAATLYAKYLARLAEELEEASGLFAYDLWNEPALTNYALDALPKATVCAYTTQWYDSLKAHDPDRLVTLGGTAHEELGSWDPAVMKLDFYAPHLYPTPELVDGDDIAPAVERVKAQLYWLGADCPMPYVIGETAFSAEADTVDPMDFHTGPDNKHLDTVDAHHRLPYMHGTEQQQADYATGTIDATRNYLGSGYAWWGFQNNRGANLADEQLERTYFYNWFGLLKYGNTGYGWLPPPWDTPHPWRDKPVVAALENYTLPAEPEGLPAPPANYFDWYGLTDTVERSYTLVDQYEEPVANAMVEAVWFYGDAGFGVVDFWTRTPTDGDGECVLRKPPTLQEYTSPVPVRLTFKASGGETVGGQWFESWPMDGEVVMDRERLFFARTVADATVPIGSTVDWKAWAELTVDDAIVEGDGTSGGTADLHARHFVHGVEGFHAKYGSTVHLHTEDTWTDCGSSSYRSLIEGGGVHMERSDLVPARDPQVRLQFRPAVPSFTVHPNPCTEWFKMETSVVPGMCTVIDLQGRVIQRTPIIAEHSTISTSLLPAGQYIVRYEVAEQQFIVPLTRLQ